MTSNLFDLLRRRESNFKIQNQVCFEKTLHRERLSSACNLFQTDLRGHCGCVNEVQFSECGNFMASGGYDKNLLVWNLEKCLSGDPNPYIIKKKHATSILCLAFDKTSDVVIAGARSGILYTYDLRTKQIIDETDHKCRVFDISIDPETNNKFAVGCIDGGVVVYDRRVNANNSLTIQWTGSAFQSVQYHPLNNNLLMTGHAVEGIALYDVRRPFQYFRRYKTMLDNSIQCTCARFNSTGNMIVASGKKLPLILYKFDSSDVVCSFSDKHYLNSCTRKSGTFAGEDEEFIVVGSDDFNIYFWRMSDVNLNNVNQVVNKKHMTLYGHRSIVSNVRYNRQKCLLASCGVEKVIKLWSPFNYKNWIGSLTETGERFLSVRELNPYRFTFEFIPHLVNYTFDTLDEDPCMIALFDFLLYKEYVLGYSTNSLMRFV